MIACGFPISLELFLRSFEGLSYLVGIDIFPQQLTDRHCEQHFVFVHAEISPYTNCAIITPQDGPAARKKFRNFAA
jgi:hypothetical protein